MNVYHRQAKTVFRPNDGPGDMGRRYELARELRKRACRKGGPKEPEYSPAVLAAVRAVALGAFEVYDAAKIMGLKHSSAASRLKAAICEGLIYRTGTSPHVYRLTDEGRALAVKSGWAS